MKNLNNKPSRKGKLTGFYLPDHEYAQLQLQTKLAGMSASDYMRSLLGFEVVRHKPERPRRQPKLKTSGAH
jgi:hypothetical protein